MFCKNCGKEMKDGSAFCSECGTKNEQGTTEVNTQIDATAFQSAMSNSSGTAVAVKKKSKGKFILIGVFVFLFIIVIACAVSGSDSPFGEYEEEDVVKTLTISTIRDQYSISHDQDVYDIEILDKDDYYNYIVSATTESKQGFETWWYVLLKFDIESGNYRTYIHWHGEDDFNGEIDGGRFTKNNIPDYYRTNEKFGWGKENKIEIE